MSSISIDAPKRQFTIQAPRAGKFSDTQVTVLYGNWQARDGGLMVARDGGELVFRATSGFPVNLDAPRRVFTIQAPKVEVS